MKITSLIILTSYVLLLFNCNKSPTESEPKDLLTTLWTLESFNIEGNIVKPPNDQLYTIQFKIDSTVSGKNDCNDFYANYLVTSDNYLRFEQLVTTKKGCGGDQSISEKYIQGLYGAKSYKIHKNSLYIYYGNESTLIFYSE